MPRRSVGWLAGIVLAAAVFMTAAAAPRFTDPWPDRDTIRGVRVETITLASSDPFAPADIGHAPARAVAAELFLPPEARPASPVPAVVFPGSEVTVISYPGAVHQWDGPLSRRLIGRQHAGCRFRVARDGTVRDDRTMLPMTGPFLRRIILGLCTEGRP